MRSVVCKRGIVLVLAVLPVFAQLVTRAPQFQLTPLHGVDFILRNSPTPRKYLIETMPGGVALLDVRVASGITPKKGRGLGVAFADYDGDGFTDVFVTNDALRQFLFQNNRNATFSEVALDSGAALNNAGKMPSGMGVVFQDYDNDGLPDLLITQLPHEPYVVFHNDGNKSFSAQELETGFGALSETSSGWGVAC